MVRSGRGGTVMPTFEWTEVGDEPGCRQAAAAMDPQIKLFGQTISVSPSHTGAGADAEFLNPSSAYTAPPSSQDGGDSVQQRGAESKGASESLVRALSSSSRDEELLQLHVKSRECGVAPASGVPHLCDEQSEGVVSDERDSQSVGSDGSKSQQQQKVEKVLPCPRCSSEDTKFCYYNNYNVNQPRHFCKNCQRYWTAGGTLRNVPVGAGRRKNKASGGVHRENSEASSFQMELGEFSCGVGSPKVKVSHPKRVAGQGSPVRSPGSSGQESGISMSSPPYSVYQNGRQSLQSFISVSHGFNTSGTEANRMGSSDSASTMRGSERLAQFFPGNGGSFDKDCRRLSLQSKQMQDAGAHNESSDTEVSGWVNNFGGRQQPVREWQPHGYLADWNDGEHHHSVVSQPFASGSAGINSAGAPPAWASTPWASSHPTWTGNNPHHPLHGKRQNELVEDCYSAKRMRTEVEIKREWPVRTNHPESDILKQLLQQPKLEHLGAAYEPKDSFMSRLFNNTTGPWPVPFPVAI